MRNEICVFLKGGRREHLLLGLLFCLVSLRVFLSTVGLGFGGSDGCVSWLPRWDEMVP